MTGPITGLRYPDAASIQGAGQDATARAAAATAQATADAALPGAPGTAQDALAMRVASVAALRALAKPTAALTAILVGYYAAGDIAAEIFRYDGASTAADDGGTVFAPDAGGTGRWTRPLKAIESFKAWGAHAAGVNGTDDGPVWSALNTACAAAGGIQVTVGSGTYAIKTQTTIDSPNFKVIASKGAVFDLHGITGTGVGSYHNTVNMLSMFNVVSTADDFRFEGGRITGPSGSGDGKNICGILLNGCTNPKVSRTKLDSMYTSIWPGKGATNIILEDLILSTLSHNLMLGAQEGVSSQWEVDRCVVRGVDSSGSINDGSKLQAWCRFVTYESCHHHGNTRDGLDMFVGGEETTVLGCHFEHNTIRGCDMKYDTNLTGSGAQPAPNAAKNRGGYNRRVRHVAGNYSENTSDGISIATAVGTTQSEDIAIQNCQIRGNGARGVLLDALQFSVTGNHVLANFGQGIRVMSCFRGLVGSNQVHDNCTGQDAEGIFCTDRGDAVASQWINIDGNAICGPGTGANQRQGLSVGTSKMTNSMNCNNLGQGQAPNFTGNTQATLTAANNISYT